MAALPEIVAGTVQTNILVAPEPATGPEEHGIDEIQLSELAASEATGVDSPNDVQKAVTRPVYRRIDSSPQADQQVDEASHRSSHDLYASETAVAFAAVNTSQIAPAQPLESVPHPPLAGRAEESIFRRRLRMTASFCALYLAGWK